jgi:hypothetical protein
MSGRSEPAAKAVSAKLAKAIGLDVVAQLQEKLESIQRLDVPYDNKAIRREVAVERALLDMVGAIAGEAIERQCAEVLGYREATESNSPPYMAWGEHVRYHTEARMALPKASSSVPEARRA